MISIRDVRKSFGSYEVLRGVSLEVAAGESVALCGANGTGKSTLIQCITGVHRFGGSITIGGFDITRDGKQARRLLGYVPQELAFRDEMRLDEVVRFFAALRGLRRVNTAEVLAPVALADHARARARDLSGGMKQRLALAIALLGDPAVLLLDELSASLDAEGRAAFLHMLVDLRGAGRTVLFASHRAEEVAILAGRAVWLVDGRLSDRPSAARPLGPNATATKEGFHAAVPAIS